VSNPAGANRLPNENGGRRARFNLTRQGDGHAFHDYRQSHPDWESRRYAQRKAPDEKLLKDMRNFNEVLVKAGVMLAGERLHRSKDADLRAQSSANAAR
jgi:hypothetical protein